MIHTKIISTVFVVKVLLLLLLLLRSAFADDPDLPGGGTNEPREFKLTLPEDTISDFPGEEISVQNLKFNHRYNDVFLPGNNDMNMVVTRHNKGSRAYVGWGTKWHLDLPYIGIRPDINPVSGGEYYGCLGTLKYIEVGFNGSKLRSMGLGHSSHAPANAIALFDNLMILRCENGYPVLISDKNKRYHFGKQVQTGAGFIYLLTKQSDRFGNTLTYQYQSTGYGAYSFYLGHMPVHKLLSITRNDGASVTLEYQSKGSRQHIRRLRFGDNRQFNYQYTHNALGGAVLHKTIDPAGRITTYTPSQYMDFVSKITTHEGLTVEYDYYPVNADSSNNGNIRHRTIYGPGIKKRVIFSTLPAFFGGDRSVLVEFNLEGSARDLYTEYVWDKTPPAQPYYQSGQIALSGRLKSTRLYYGDNSGQIFHTYPDLELLYEQVNEWDYTTLGPAYCKRRINSFLDHNHSCAIARKRKVRTKIKTANGYDTFFKAFTAFNEYGLPYHWHEYNGYSSKKRYHKKSFFHDKRQWFINAPAAQWVSSDNVSWLLSTQNTYYPYSAGGGHRLRLKEQKPFGVRQWLMHEYHADGNIKTAKNATGASYTYLDYVMGIPSSTFIPSVNVPKKLELTQDATFRSVTDRNGNKTGYRYDGLRRLTKTIYPADNLNNWHEQNIRYQLLSADEQGLGAAWKRVITRGSYQNTHFLDANNNIVLTQEKDNSDNASVRYRRNQYDRWGRLTFKGYPSTATAAEHGEHMTYDVLGRITRVAHPDGVTHFEYLNQHRIKMTDPKGHVSIYHYLSYADPEDKALIRIESPETVTTSLTRNVLGKITRIHQAGVYNGASIQSARHITYDNRQLLCRQYNPETGYTAYYHNNAGQLRWTLNTSVNHCNGGNAVPDGATVYHYNPRGQLIAVDFPGATADVFYEYDNNGNPVSASRRDNHIDYAYNSRNRIRTETLTVDNRAFLLSYGFDNHGHVSSLTYPSGRRVDFLPNALGQASKAGAYASGARYHANGLLSGFRYGNNRSWQQTLNARGYPERIAAAGIADISYQYDPASNLQSITNHLASAENRTLHYDGLHRLVTAHGPWGVAHFKYDPLGNRMAKRLGGEHYHYTIDRSSNRLKAVGGTRNYTIQWDSNGNITGNGHESYQFDQNNLLLSVNDGNTARYDYDAHRRRVTTREGNKTTYSFYNHKGRLLHKASGSSEQDYIYLGPQLIAKHDSQDRPPFVPYAPLHLWSPPVTTAHNYLLTWQIATGATRYLVEEKLNGATWATLYSGANTSYRVNNRSPALRFYRIKACSSAGCSPFSPTITVNRQPLVPPAPGGLSSPATDVDGNFNVSWQAATHGVRYELQEQVNTGPWQTVYSGPGRAKAIAGKTYATYHYRVRACSHEGCGVFSAPIRTIRPVPVPATPSGITAPALTKRHYPVRVTWRATTWATRYEVWRKFNNNPWVKLQNNATTRYSYTASSLGIYQVYVKACNTSGCSGATPVVKTDVRKYLPGGGCKASADNPVKCP